MKKIVFVLALVLSCMISMAQNNTRDVVYLKNGSIIKGEIIELSSNENIKIQTVDGSVYVYPFDQVEKIEKEKQSSPTDGINIGEEYKGKHFGSHNDDIYAGDSFYGLGTHVFTENELKSILSDELFASYVKGVGLYRSGQSLKNIGWVLFVVGPTLVALSSIADSKSLSSLCIISGTVSFVVGNVFIPIGYVKRGVGKGMVSGVAERCDVESHNRESGFVFSPTIINCNLPQNDCFALGMTFRINL